MSRQIAAAQPSAAGQACETDYTGHSLTWTLKLLHRPWQKSTQHTHVSKQEAVKHYLLSILAPVGHYQMSLMSQKVLR